MCNDVKDPVNNIPASWETRLTTADHTVRGDFSSILFRGEIYGTRVIGVFCTLYFRIDYNKIYDFSWCLELIKPAMVSQFSSFDFTFIIKLYKLKSCHKDCFLDVPNVKTCVYKTTRTFSRIVIPVCA